MDSEAYSASQHLKQEVNFSPLAVFGISLFGSSLL
jgi:hypothetical protein